MRFKGKKVLVMDGGSRQCLPILKGLHELGCDITTINCSKFDNGFSSRYPSTRLLRKPEEDLVDYLTSVVNQNNYDVLIPLSDESMDKITPYIEDLRKVIRIPVPDREVFLRAYDKQITMQYCANNLIPCPITLLKSFDIEYVKEKICFPLIAKPRMACGSKGLKIVKNVNELLKLIESNEVIIEEYVIQEFIPQSGKQYNVHLFMDDNQNLCSGVVTEKTRWYPVDGGASCLCRTIENERVLSDCERLLKSIKWKGYCEIELIEDPRDGLFKVMEINGRASASIKIMDLAGINVAQQMMELAFNVPVTQMAVKHNDIRMRRLSTDILWFIQSKDRFSRKPSWFSLNRTHEVVFSIHDPKPFFVTGLSLFTKITSYGKEMQMRRR